YRASTIRSRDLGTSRRTASAIGGSQRHGTPTSELRVVLIPDRTRPRPLNHGVERLIVEAKQRDRPCGPAGSHHDANCFSACTSHWRTLPWADLCGTVQRMEGSRDDCWDRSTDR